MSEQSRKTGSLASALGSIGASGSAVLRLVQAAARRRTFTLALQHSALTLLAILSGAVLLLLLGSDLLAWPWLVSLTAAGLVLTAARFRRDRVERYRVAQIVDTRLGLKDSLATAWYLLAHPAENASGLATAQIAQAEQQASGIRPAAAFPFVWRRTWGAVAALAALAFGLFAARYLVTSTLSLKPSLIPLQALFSGHELTASKADLPPLGGEEGDARQPARRAPNATPRGKDDRGTPQAGPQPAGSQANASSPEKRALGQSPGEANNPSRSAASQNQTQASNRQTSARAGDAKKNAGGGERDTPSAQEAQSDKGQPPSSSLAERMKEALSGLLDKMQPRRGTPGEGPGERTRENREASNANPSARSPNDASKRDSKSSATGQSDRNSQAASAQASAQASEKLTGPASRAADENAGRKGNDAHSGIGRQDGEKTLREAEQLRAMGKLEEIIGKRSAGLTGAMTVETQSGKQQLQTQYSGRLGNHADLGGEIDRNEVPLALQNYVREYMEQVRKPANGNQ